MLQINNKQKILKLFQDSPTTDFLLRQISRLAGVAPPSTLKYLKELQKEGLINKSEKGLYPAYRAIRDNPSFKELKKWSTAHEINKCGLTDYLIDACGPDAIILFGSAAKGEDIESSDIDLAILAQEAKLDLAAFENRLKRKISILFIKRFSNLSPELKNNIINGIILSGYLQVF